MKKINWLIIFPIIAIISLGVCIYVNSLPITETKRETVVIYTDNGELADSYETFNDYSNDITVTEDGMPNHINADDTAISNNTPQSTYSYCGNKNSKIFHKKGCSSINKTKEENKIYFPSKEEYINNGYKPCSRCNP